MRKVLFLCQLLPYPLDAGPKIRSYYVLRHLQQSHHVTLVSFVREDDSSEAIEHLHAFCDNLQTVPIKRSIWRDFLALVKSLASGRSWIITRDENGKLFSLLKQLTATQHFDIIHADQLWMAPYALEAKKASFLNIEPQLVLDQHNAVHMIPKRMALNSPNPFLRFFMNLESNRLLHYELETIAQFDKVVWVTEQDQKAVNFHPAESSQPIVQDLKGQSTIIPICVDPDVVESKHDMPDDPNILFVGGMHWPPNLEGVRWFINKVFPLVRQTIPKASCTIIGKLPPRDILNAEGIHSPGFVKDIGPYYEQARIFVVPLLSGGGMRVKILDAWMRSLPVVSTRIGAKGLKYSNSEDIIIADQPETFASSLIRLLQDGEACARIGASGRRTVEKYYDWKKVYPSWDQVYREIE